MMHDDCIQDIIDLEHERDAALDEVERLLRTIAALETNFRNQQFEAWPVWDLVDKTKAAAAALLEPQDG